MKQVFANNGYAELAAAITDTDTTLSIAASNGIPVLEAEEYFSATLYTPDSRYGSNIEIIHVTSVDGVTGDWTAVRGQEGTDAVAHGIGDNIELRLTAGGLETAAQQAGGVGTPDWPVELSYSTDGDLVEAVYSQGNVRLKQTLNYNAAGDLETVVYEHSSDAGEIFELIGTETLVYESGNLIRTEWEAGL